MNISAFIKFGEKEHLQQLRGGKVFFNSLDYFRNLSVRHQGDIFEGATYLKRVDPKKMTIDLPPEMKQAFFKNPRLYQCDPSVQGHIFCLSIIYQSTINSLLDGTSSELMKLESFGFGEYFTIIHKPRLFRDKLHEKLSGQNNCVSKPIEYFSYDRYEGPLTPFMKSTKFQDQQEYRFGYADNDIEPHIYDIGNIESITSEVMPVEFIPKIKVKLG